MDGTKRSSIRRGLRVAIVLKEDQGTGRRTVGEVGQILTSSDTHPHGIKVRLTDGQVGRVQEILTSAPPASKAARLAVLLVENSDGNLYARKLSFESGVELVVLGLDHRIIGSERADDVALQLFKQVRVQQAPPKLLHSAHTTIEQKAVLLTAYLCKGSEIDDPQSSEWDWTGWLSWSEVAAIRERGELSEESELLFRELSPEV